MIIAMAISLPTSALPRAYHKACRLICFGWINVYVNLDDYSQYSRGRRHSRDMKEYRRLPSCMDVRSWGERTSNEADSTAYSSLERLWEKDGDGEEQGVGNCGLCRGSLLESRREEGRRWVPITVPMLGSSLLTRVHLKEMSSRQLMIGIWAWVRG